MTSAAPRLDLERLCALRSAIGSAVGREALATFARTIADDIDLLAAQIAGQATTGRPAHRLKGAALGMGLASIGQLAATIDQALKDQDLITAAVYFEALREDAGPAVAEAQAWWLSTPPVE